MTAKRIGVMGGGVVADYGHLPAIHAAPGITAHAVFDPLPGRAADFAARHGVPHAAHTLDRFAEARLDAVVVTSPAPRHIDNVLWAAQRGLPILCEKPLAMDEPEALRMIEACEAAGVPLFVAFCYRFSPSAMLIRKLVADGAIGRVRSLRLVYVWGLHGKYHQDADGRWIASERWLGRMEEGGPMVDCGVHQIDLARWWLDSDIVRATGHGAWVDQHDGTDHAYPDHVWLHLDHDNGAHTAVEVSFTYGHTTRQAYSEFVYELIGSDGMIRYDRNHGRFELRTHQGTEFLPYHEEKNFDGMYEHFSAFLHHGSPGDLCPARDAVAVTRLAREGTEQAVRQRGGAVAVGLRA